jgi:hypothetical protein
MSSSEPKNPRIVLLENHRHIEALLERLIAATRADDREAAHARWAQVERAVLTHLDVEEMFVFPSLRRGHGPEVDRLRGEHDAIRCQLGEIGLALELHTVRCEEIEGFCAALRKHAEREESLAYLQAVELPGGIAHAIAERIKRVASAVREPHSDEPRPRRV